MRDAWAVSNMLQCRFEPRSEGSDKPKKRKYTRRKKPEGEAAELQKESEGEEEVVLGFYQQGDKAAAVEYLQRLALIPSCEGFQPFSQPYAQARAILLLHREMVSAPCPLYQQPVCQHAKIEKHLYEL